MSAILAFSRVTNSLVIAKNTVGAPTPITETIEFVSTISWIINSLCCVILSISFLTSFWITEIISATWALPIVTTPTSLVTDVTLATPTGGTMVTFSLYCLTKLPASCSLALVPSWARKTSKKRSESLEPYRIISPFIINLPDTVNLLVSEI